VGTAETADTGGISTRTTPQISTQRTGQRRALVGCPWRDVPDRSGPWWRVYALLTCWQLTGMWQRLESTLVEAADAAGKLSWQVSVDQATARAHVHAAGAGRDARIGQPANQAITPWASRAAGGPPRPMSRPTSTAACWPTRPTPLARTGTGSPPAAFGRPSRSRPTRPATVPARAHTADAHTVRVTIIDHWLKRLS